MVVGSRPWNSWQDMLHDCMLRQDHVDSSIVAGKDVPEVNVGLMLGKEFFILHSISNRLNFNPYFIAFFLF